MSAVATGSSRDLCLFRGLASAKARLLPNWLMGESQDVSSSSCAFCHDAPLFVPPQVNAVLGTVLGSTEPPCTAVSPLAHLIAAEHFAVRRGTTINYVKWTMIPGHPRRNHVSWTWYTAPSGVAKPAHPRWMWLGNIISTKRAFRKQAGRMRMRMRRSMGRATSLQRLTCCNARRQHH